MCESRRNSACESRRYLSPRDRVRTHTCDRVRSDGGFHTPSLRIEVATDGELGPGKRCELRAAMLEGAAAALLDLADRQRAGAAFERAWGGGDRG